MVWAARSVTSSPAASSRMRSCGFCASECEHARALMARDLRHDVRRGAEAVEAEPFGITRQPQGPVADQPGAEQRRRLQVRVALRDRDAEALVGGGELRVAAVPVVAGEASLVAEVLASRAAVAAGGGRPPPPPHPQPGAP